MHALASTVVLTDHPRCHSQKAHYSFITVKRSRGQGHTTGNNHSSHTLATDITWVRACTSNELSHTTSRLHLPDSVARPENSVQLPHSQRTNCLQWVMINNAHSLCPFYVWIVIGLLQMPTALWHYLTLILLHLR